MFDLTYYMPTKIFYGKGCLETNQSFFSSLGKKCLIVTGKNSAKASGALDDVLKALQSCGISSEIFDEITQNPLLSACKNAGDIAKNYGADFILGIGGGSPLDAAKAVAVFAANDIAPMEIFDGNYATSPLPIVLVGTTAGTGSEVTPYSVVMVDTVGGTPRKRSIPNLFATACFCDYSYTCSLDYNFTISTALDALSHCIEGYFSKRSDSISDLFAKTGAKLIVDVLSDLTAEGNFTEKQRDKLYAGSIYGGLTITKTGTAFCHMMGYFLTEEYSVPHGIACAVYLPDYLELGCEVEYKKANALLYELDATVSELRSMIENLASYKRIHLTQTQKNELEKRWENNRSLANSPGTFTTQDAMDIIEELF